MPSSSQILNSVSQCNSQKSSSKFPQTVQRSTPTRPHPLMQQQVSGPCTQRSLPQQQSDPSLISSSMSRPLSHHVRPASNVNDSGLTHQNFPSVRESRSSEFSSSVAACSYQHIQKSLPCQQEGAPSLPSLPKLTPLPSSQPQRQSSSNQPFVQAPPNVPTPHCQLPVSSTCIDMNHFGSSVSYTSAQVPKCAESAVPSSPVIPTVSDNSTPKSNTEGSALTSDLSLNLLSSIPNSLTPSQLESLLSTSESQIPTQAVLYGNGRQGTLQSCRTCSLLPLTHKLLQLVFRIQIRISNHPFLQA